MSVNATEDDYYSALSIWYYVIQVVLIIYGVTFFGFLVLVQNANVPNTVFAANSAWGVYFSLLYNSVYWLMLILSVVRSLMFPVVYFIVMWRKSRACNIFWFVLIVVITVNDLLVVVGTGHLYGNCNLQGQTYNACNDKRWCCVTAIYSNPENGCVNSIACPPSFPTQLGELYADTDFMWFFVLNIVFFLLDVLIMLFFATEFYKSPMQELSKRDPLYQDTASSKQIKKSV